MQKSLFAKTWFISLFVSLPIAILLGYSLPITFDEYIFQVDSKMIQDGRSCNRLMYYDIDNNGISERIIAQNDDYSRSACLMLHTNKYKLLGQTNLIGAISEKANNFTAAKIFQDSIADIAIVTTKADSLFLNLVNLNYNETKTIINDSIETIFLDCIDINKFENYDYSYQIVIRDTDKDAFPEIYTIVNAGYSIRPRKLYKYDIATRQLYKSPTDGQCGNANLCFIDLNNDGVEETIGGSYAPWNIQDTTHYLFHDNNAYIMAFDSHLNLIFPSIVEYGGYTSILPQPLLTSFGPAIAVLNSTPTRNKRKQSLKIYDAQGKQINQIELSACDRSDSFVFLPDEPDSSFRLYNRFEGEELEFNEALECVNKWPLPIKTFGFKSLNIMGQKCILFFNTLNGEFALQFPDRTYAFINEISPFNAKVSEISIKNNGTENPQICIFEDESEHLITLNRNPYYKFQVPYYIVIVGFSYLFIWLLLTFQKRTISKRYKEKERLRDLELASAYNQLDPHFTFNVLNAIGSSIMTGKNEEAYEYFANLSELIRLTLEKAKDSERTLSEELNFVKKYLEIESFRFGQSFRYDISRLENIDLTITVPKMLVQIFAENALKHGLLSKHKDAQLSIIVTDENGQTSIIIEDNGIGRMASKNSNTKSTGKGIAVMEEYIRIFNQQKKRKVRFEIIDQFDNQNRPCGTRVNIKL